ncbi:MAG TPA: extracellular solute-binding protein, partial [Chloroflexota bacterium]|nr:extracellular solute-binding protein [Chloroflexota bacterium]
MFPSSRTTRRQVLMIGVLSTFGGLLAACSSSPASAPSAQPASQPTSAPATSAAPPTTTAAQPTTVAQATAAPQAQVASTGRSVKLIFWRYTAALQDSVIADFIKRYGEAHPGVSIDQANFPGLDTYRQKVLAAVAAKSAPDFLYSDGPWLPEFASRNILDPAPPEIVDDLKAHWTKGGANYVTYKGVTYGYPWETSIHQLYVNNDLFTAAGLDPTKPPNNSFQEFRTGAKKLAKLTNGTVTKAGWIANPRLFYFGNWVYNNGGSLIGEDE